MKIPDPKEPHGTERNHEMIFPKNDVAPVPELRRKTKTAAKK